MKQPAETVRDLCESEGRFYDAVLALRRRGMRVYRETDGHRVNGRIFDTQGLVELAAKRGKAVA